MIPANRILMTLRIADCGLRNPSIHNQSAFRNPHSAMSRSSLGGFDELVNAFRLVERLADREPRAHAPVEAAALEQLVVPSLRRDLAAVEHQDAVGVAHGRQAMGDDDGGAA